MSESTELWLPVPRWENSYEVSNLGQVRSLDRFNHGADGKIRRIKGQMLTPSVNSDGYRTVSLWCSSIRYCRKVGVLVLQAFVGPPPPGMECCHEDGNHKHDELGNLRWDTRRANVADAMRHGTHYNARGRR
jgi:NUMOD4 motif